MGQDDADLDDFSRDEDTGGGESTVTAGFRPMEEDLSEDTVIINEPTRILDDDSDEVTRIDHPRIPTLSTTNCVGPIAKPSTYSVGTSKLVPIFLEDEALFKDAECPYSANPSNFYPFLDQIRVYAHSDPFTPPPRVWSPPPEEENVEDESREGSPSSRSGSGFYVTSTFPPYKRPRPLWQYFSVTLLLTVMVCLPLGYFALAKGKLQFLTLDGAITPAQIEHPHGLKKVEKRQTPVVPKVEAIPDPTPCEKEKEWGRRDVLFRDLKLTLSQDRVVMGTILGVQDCSLRFKEEGRETPILIPLETIVSSDLDSP